MTSHQAHLDDATQNSRLWLSHHRCDQSERCVTVGGQLVCRRCLTLYPSVIAVAVVAHSIGIGPGLSTGLLVTMTLIPFLIDWMGEHAGRFDYSPFRQVAVSLIAGVGGGIALGVHVDHPFDPTVTIPIALCAGVALLSAMNARRGRSDDGADSTQWSTRFDQDEIDRELRLRSMLESSIGSDDHESL
ncbi:MAG: hypothetical protein KDB26_07520 [Microthrixaceae bacterium]|nr:hypothetical protein [Microthrixaceae bacterium]